MELGVRFGGALCRSEWELVGSIGDSVETSCEKTWPLTAMLWGCLRLAARQSAATRSRAPLVLSWTCCLASVRAAIQQILSQLSKWIKICVLSSRLDRMAVVRAQLKKNGQGCSLCRRFDHSSQWKEIARGRPGTRDAMFHHCCGQPKNVRRPFLCRAHHDSGAFSKPTKTPGTTTIFSWKY